MQNLKENQIVVLKMTRIWWILIWALKSLEICTLIGPFCVKFMFALNVTEESSSMILKSHAKFDEKLTCGLENDMRNLAHFHQNTWTCQNCYFHGILLSEVENTRANNLQRLCVMTLKNKKSEEELTCCSKTDMRNFNSNTQKSEKFAL